MYSKIKRNTMGTQTKQCNQCLKTKALTEFHKRKASKDGLQLKCKSCVKVVNENFRETNPQYQVSWQRKNWTMFSDYLNRWREKNVKADDSHSAIYTIISPDNKYYVGKTQTYFPARMNTHKRDYRTKHGKLPLLHESFDKFGIENHIINYMPMYGVDNETLRTIESTMILDFKQKGISLNVRI